MKICFLAPAKALATSISYAIVWQVRVFVVRTYMDIKIHWLRDYFIYLLLYAQAVVNIYFCRVVPKLPLINTGVVVLVIVLYRNIMIEILQKAGSIKLVELTKQKWHDSG